MKDNYKIEKRGEYYCLLNNGKVEYKSKDEQKVKSKYQILRITEIRKETAREAMARNGFRSWL
jgi:hypothetical protein